MVMGSLGGLPVYANRWDRLAGLHPDPLPTLSVIVAHFEQQAQLARTLLALDRQDYPRHLVEIIVVDDGSSVKPHVPPGVTLILQPDDGFRLAAARNRGAESARGRVLVFLDADTSPEPGYLRLLSRLPALAPDCVTVGRRKHADFAHVGLTERVEAAGPHELPEPRWLADAYALTHDLLEADDRSYRFIIGAVMACNRAMFQTVGGFDESFTTYGGEDWDWAYRAWLAGAVLAHEPAAIAWHDGPQWGERGDDDAGRLKNDETIRLSRLIGVPGSGPRGLRVGRPDVALSGSSPASSEAAEYITIDSALADLPGAAVVSGRHATHDDAAWVGARIRITFARACVVGRHALRDAVAEVTRDALGSLTLTDDSGWPLVTISSARAAAREARWGQELFPTRLRSEPRIVPVTAEPDLEAYLGGWPASR